MLIKSVTLTDDILNQATIPYENDNELDDKINRMLAEMDSEADIKNCFIEADVTAMDGSDRSW